jgi:hypothetical protein
MEYKNQGKINSHKDFMAYICPSWVAMMTFFLQIVGPSQISLNIAKFIMAIMPLKLNFLV